VPWQRDYEINRMVTLAAMIDRVDQEIGRLLVDLEKNKQRDNTLILFFSDNGTCPYDRKKPLLNVEPTNGDISFGDSTGWAWARNSPFRYYKQNQYEGGISPRRHRGGRLVSTSHSSQSPTRHPKIHFNEIFSCFS